MLVKKYNHELVENDRYQKWLDKDLFKAGDTSKEPFCIVIPPPNITGKLHLGHSLDASIQDIIIRFKKMSGYDALWLPGMDHAGIATQAKIDEKLKNQGINPREMNREEWLEYAWSWKDEYASLIRQQWAKLGLSLDYSRERFTMDEGLNKAVTEVFVKLYNKGLIYRGNRIVNWDPIANTALSNVEVIYKDIEGAFYYLKYMIEGTNDYLEIATTRPETIFGDTAVAVNPKDKRYQSLIGKNVVIPIINRIIPIIADEHADMEFGTGVVKITPAHDPNDFEVGKRHALPEILCMTPKGIMNEESGPFNGQDRFDCRNNLLIELKEKDLLIKEEKIIHAVGHSERTDSIVEPYLSNQWFVKMDALAKQLLDNQKKDQEKVSFVPPKFEKTLNNWMENIQDWCISRQLWWGHRIPAWYREDEIYIGNEKPLGDGWIQDEDVLDTWFSSALWPFSTLGWPEETNDLKRYFPTNVLVTGYDIIFFWVGRMIFQSLEFMDSHPFDTTILHGIIRDKYGIKMSKSLGNGLDPSDVINSYGADALRLCLTTNNAMGQDFRYEEEKVKASWNFINKLWNASIFVINNIDGFNEKDYDFTNLKTYDKWILNKLNKLIKSANNNLNKYDLNNAGNDIISFVWNQFCDWYIEFAKSSMQELSTKTTLHYTLSNILKLLHPYIPFVTEEIFLNLNPDKTSILLEVYPVFNKEHNYIEADKKTQDVIELIKKIRAAKLEYNFKDYSIIINKKEENVFNLLTDNKELLIKILRLDSANFLNKDDNNNITSMPLSIGTLELSFVSIKDDLKDENDLQKDLKLLTESIARRKQLLSNANYLKNAPQNIVNQEKDSLDIEEKKLATIKLKLN